MILVESSKTNLSTRICLVHNDHSTARHRTLDSRSSREAATLRKVSGVLIAFMDEEIWLSNQIA